jgi:hypothetical protein
MKFRLTAKQNHDSILMGQDTVRLCEMQGIIPRMKDKKGLDTRTKNNILAFKAEFLFAKLFSLPDPVVNVATDGGIDFWLGDLSIDVKCSTRDSGPLIFDSEDKFAASVAVLYTATDDPRVLNLHGCVTRKDFFERAYRKDFGYGNRYVLDADDMAPIEHLWRYHIETTMAYSGE